MDDLLYPVWLSAKTGVKPLIKYRLFRSLGSFKRIYDCLQSDYAEIEGIRPSDIRALADKDLKRAQGILDYCGRSGINIFCIDDPRYPDRLKNIFDPPVVLYVKGDLPDVDSSPVISVIGTRKADDYGLRVSYDIAYEISAGGGIVVSGLTAGADASAAEGALASGRPLLAVLGTSFDKTNTSLSGKVAACGALISEYPPGTEPNKSFFRARNRIASGLSVGVVVTQAPEKSGTRLFAAEAAEQGKDIYVVPGNVDSANSAGIYELMRDGAVPVISGSDVLNEYKHLFPDTIISGKVEVPAHVIGSESRLAVKRSMGTKKNAKADSFDNSSSTAYINLHDKLDSLSGRQRTAADCLLDGPKFVEEIMYISGIPVNELLSLMTVLEIKGVVRRAQDGRYSLK